MEGVSENTCLDYAVVEEADELQGIVNSVVQSGGKAAGSVHDRYKQIVRSRCMHINIAHVCSAGC